MLKTILLTQCLQNDFVAPLPAGAPLPNLLHIGRAESLRLLGDPHEDWSTHGPLARFLAAWEEGAGADHVAIHIRDWHRPAAAATRAHLEHFGAHCLAETEGAQFVAPLRALAEGGLVVDSAVLSDFVGTALPDVLSQARAGAAAVRVGVIGVWTDFKVRYLAYELMTQAGLTAIAVCSALTASRSRTDHRHALEHLASSLGVTVIDSIPEFLGWLGLRPWAGPRSAPGQTRPTLVLPADLRLDDEERRLIEHLFREAREVRLSPLGGGFSGSRVFRTASRDRDGHDEVPFVVKIDSHAKIARERVAVESVENLLGAASPRLVDYIDLESLGAIQYQFATMHGGEVTTLKRAFASAASPDAAATLFENVEGRVLSRLYQRPCLDRLQLFDYYSYRPEYAVSTLRRVSELAGREDHDHLELDGLPDVLPHPRRFYETLSRFLAEEAADVPLCWIHGDLNLANVVLDASGNTWLIDYFWTRVGHAWQDLAKLENDLKFLLVPLPDDAALVRAVAWERLLQSSADLSVPVPALPPTLAVDTHLAKAHAAVTRLRALAARLAHEAGQRDSPLSPRPYRIAQLRYSAHSLGFDECQLRQQRFALASTCLLADSLAGLRVV